MADRPPHPLHYAPPDATAYRQTIGLMVGTLFGIALGGGVMVLLALYVYHMLTSGGS